MRKVKPAQRSRDKRLVSAVVCHLLKAETFGDDDIVGGRGVRETEVAKLRG